MCGTEFCLIAGVVRPRDRRRSGAYHELSRSSTPRERGAASSNLPAGLHRGLAPARRASSPEIPEDMEPFERPFLVAAILPYARGGSRSSRRSLKWWRKERHAEASSRSRCRCCGCDRSDVARLPDVRFRRGRDPRAVERSRAVVHVACRHLRERRDSRRAAQDDRCSLVSAGRLRERRSVRCIHELRSPVATIRHHYSELRCSS